MLKSCVLAIVCCLLLAAPPLYWFTRPTVNPDSEPAEMLTRYLQHLYARDFRRAYPFLSSADRRLKALTAYVQERGEFTGFALDAARTLARRIVIHPRTSETKGAQHYFTVAMKLPDANGIANLLLDWDEQKLNALTASERTHLLAKIDELAAAGKLPMIEGEEQFVVVKEGPSWKVFVDWAAGAQVQFAATIPSGGEIVAEPLTKQTMVRAGEPFTIGFKVKNPTTREVMTRIAHRVEPKELSQFLQLVECALLLPVRMRPGEAQTFRSTYLIRGDLPDGIDKVNVTYDFRIENR
jgi:hypothetical protein